jgi:uncharacterized membrane protein
MTAQAQRTLLGRFRTIFLRGVGIIIPLAITYWIFNAFLNWVDSFFSPTLEQLIGRHVPGLGFLTMLVIVFLVGLVTRNLVGKLFFTWLEDILTSIPFVRSVYSAVKDLVSAFALGGKGKTFRKVLLVEFPRKGLYTIGFVTNEMVITGPDGIATDYFNVYVPNPPNPTSGFLVLVPKAEAIQLSLSIEEGLKLSLSGGIVLPTDIRSTPVDK